MAYFVRSQRRQSQSFSPPICGAPANFQTRSFYESASDSNDFVGFVSRQILHLIITCLLLYLLFHLLLETFFAKSQDLHPNRNNGGHYVDSKR
jgi:hypothetical protein